MEIGRECDGWRNIGKVKVRVGKSDERIKINWWGRGWRNEIGRWENSRYYSLFSKSVWKRWFTLRCYHALAYRLCNFYPPILNQSSPIALNLKAVLTYSEKWSIRADLSDSSRGRKVSRIYERKTRENVFLKKYS